MYVTYAVQPETYVGPRTPTISKMISSNMVQESAKINEKRIKTLTS